MLVVKYVCVSSTVQTRTLRLNVLSLSRWERCNEGCYLRVDMYVEAQDSKVGILVYASTLAKVIC